jgi:hypothetical protein
MVFIEEYFSGANTTSFSVLDDERIAVVTGDLIGW